MVFASPIFVFYFLPIVLVLYFAVLGIRVLAGKYLRSSSFAASYGEGAANRTHSFFDTLVRKASSFWLPNCVILLFSLLFYYWGETNKTFILLTVILFNYCVGLFLAPNPSGIWKKYRKTIFITCIALNIGCLFIFKYLVFSVSLITNALGSDFSMRDIALPLGISFFLFQAISYIIDVYRGIVVVNKSFVGFACYIAMFPQLVAGPIVRYTDIVGHLKLRVVSVEKFASGVERFAFGLAKKVLVANHVAIFADKVFGLEPENLTTSLAWLGILCYAIQIYYDFSGYSDMAIGMGRMFGFDFKENFLFPYAAISMQDFWRRWHISLSTWFRDYLYIPLGGSRKGTLRTYLNLCLVFVLCGLWHGAAVNFVLWGMYHGAFLIFERMTKLNFKKYSLLGRVYTIIAILFGWLLFRAESFEQIMYFAKAMLGMNASLVLSSVPYAWLWFSFDVKLALLAGMLFSQPIYNFMQKAIIRWMASSSTIVSRIGLTVGQYGRVLIALVLLMACLPYLINDSYNPFIYFRF